MLLRNPFSTTKKFFQKTIQNFKSIFSGGSYERLPKSPGNAPYSYSVGNDMVAQKKDFADRWDTEQAKKTNKDKIMISSPATRQEKEDVFSEESPVKNHQIQRKGKHYSYKNVRQVQEGKGSQKDSRTRELVTQKLKELEMMDISNVDHVLDVEEVLHYYSRLTCPAYLDIVDKFFMDMYAEFIGPPVTPRSINSRPRVHSVRP